MKHKKKYITLASMVALGGLVTASQMEDVQKNKAETNGNYEVVYEEADTLEEVEAPVDYFGLYTDTGVVWDSDLVETGGIKVYSYTVGDNFIGGLQLSNALRPDFTYNMYYTLTKTDFDGKNKEVLVDNKQYTENQDIQVAGKGEGIYNFIIQMSNEQDPDDKIIVNTTIYEQEALAFKLNVDKKDPKKAAIETKSEIESITYNLIKYGGIEEETIDGGEIIKTETVKGTGVPDSIFSELDKGNYALEAEASSKPYALTSGISETVKSTEKAEFEVTKAAPLKPSASVTISSEVNPLDILGTQSLEESEISWVVKDSKDKEVASEKTNQVYIPVLKDLSAGNYTATFTETATDGTKSTADTAFKIVKPAIKLDVTKKDPAEIKAQPSGVDGNTFYWEIVKGEEVISFGDTVDVDNALLNNLEKGDYTINFKEIDAYANESETNATFAISEKGNAGVIDEDTTIVDGGTGEVIGGDNNNGTPNETPNGTTPEGTTPDGTIPNENGGTDSPEVTAPDSSKPNGNPTVSDGTSESLPSESSKQNTNISEDKPDLQDVEIKALHWGKEVDKSVNAPELISTYGYANIKQDSPLYLKSWDANGEDGVAAQDEDADPIEYSDGNWRNNNVIKGVDFGKNLDELVGRYLASDEGKAYAKTADGSKSVENYTETLKQTDKSSVMVSLGFLLTAIGLGFVLTYFFDKKKKGTVVSETKTEETPVKEESQAFTVEEVDLKKDVETPKDEK